MQLDNNPNLDTNYSSMMGSPIDPSSLPVNNLPQGQSFAAEALQSGSTEDTMKALGKKYKVSKSRGKRK